MPAIVEGATISEAGRVLKKRKMGNKSRKAKKKVKVFQGSGEKVKIDRKTKKLFRKRAREYNSDDDDDAGKSALDKNRNAAPVFDDRRNSEADELNEEPQVSDDEDEDEDNEVLPAITKFAEGCRAFRAAFKSIIKKSASDDVLGPILSGQKKLVAQKLAEEESEKKLKGEVKKEKHLVAEKGHVKPANYLDAHEKFLIGVATKGVVKLFNAVNKAQNAQKGLNPSSSKDAKAIKKRRKEAFFTALGKPSASMTGSSAKVNALTDGVGSEPPSWAPLRDNYMLTNSKLKDWDKMQETPMEEDVGKISEGSSSDDD
ncbi:RRP15-like protein [Punica granatum]|uniref:RRP15-like protein n=2 Tax=Punica granatum TaxID=22663 RepID=A0A6P8ECH7_PUNGR|nr:RRP15-like protein [Punica granatum]XP_031407753.1 RRP15-like protein [Punica granatum]PKI31516.1 hypothetical protein CRG98_048097 [Punica granatum]